MGRGDGKEFQREKGIGLADGACVENWIHEKSVNLRQEDLPLSHDTESAEAPSLPEPWWAPSLEG